jgi:hypothetical protein
MLRNGDADEKLEAIRAAAAAGQAAASLVPDLAALLLSDEFVHNISTAHAPLCEHATYAIRDIGVAPDRETLRTLLASDRVMESRSPASIRAWRCCANCLRMPARLTRASRNRPSGPSRNLSRWWPMPIQG